MPLLFGPETLESGSTPWSFDSVGNVWGGATIGLDSTSKVVGTKSLAMGATAEGSALALKTLAGDSSEIYVQFRVFFPTGFSFLTATSASLISLRTNADADVVSLNVENWGSDAIQLTTWNAVTSTWADTGLALSKNVVHKIEMRFKQATSGGYVEVWRNSNATSPSYSSGSINTGATAFRKLYYGVAYSQAAHNTFYMDEFTADTAFIGGQTDPPSTNTNALLLF